MEKNCPENACVLARNTDILGRETCDLIAASSWAFAEPLRAEPQCPYL